MSMKRLLSAVFGVLLLLTLSEPAVLAMEEPRTAPEPEISVMYTYVNQANTSLSISSSGTATIYGFVQRTPAGKYIYLSSTLQRKINEAWSGVTGWSESSTSSSTSILETYQVSSGTYRVKTYYYVSGDSGYESRTIYSKNLTY